MWDDRLLSAEVTERVPAETSEDLPNYLGFLSPRPIGTMIIILNDWTRIVRGCLKILGARPLVMHKPVQTPDA